MRLAGGLEVLNRQRKVRLDLSRLEARLRAVMEVSGVADADVALLLVSDRAIRALNRRWRNVDRPTDCISFPSGEGVGPSGERHLGDIVISVERALAQGVERAQPGTPPDQAVEDEIFHLFVHSLLHLLGHNHESDEEARRMSAAERRLARLVAEKITPPPRPARARPSSGRTAGGMSGQA